jgi:fructose-1,6-bisphosphatase II
VCSSDLTNGTLLKGVRKKEDGIMLTHSFVSMGGRTQNYHFIEAHHK